MTHDVASQLKRYVTKALDTPEWFFEDFLRFPLLPWQYKMINAALDVQRNARGLKCRVNKKAKPRITVRSCHGPGKTQGMAALAHIFNFVNYGTRIAVTAPKQDQLTRRFLPRYRRVMRDAPEVYKRLVKVKGREVALSNNRDWGLALETAVDPDNLAGYHDEPQLFLVDEASSKRLDAMFPTIEGALTTPGSCLVEIGNPTRLTGEFYQHHTRKELEALYYRLHISYKDGRPYITDDWVRDMALKYGVDSPVYKIRVLGEFASFDEAILIPFEYIDDALTNERAPDGSLPTLRVSVDVADGGGDKTVVTVARLYGSFVHVLQQKSFNFPPSVAPLKAARAAITLFEAHGGDKEVDDFVVDANGVGAGTAGTLIESGYNVVRYYGSNSSDDKDRWRNKRVQCHIALYEHFRDDTIVIDRDGVDDVDELILHLLAIKWANPDTRTEDIITKEKVKQDAGFSPDRTDSLAMLMSGAVPEQTDIGDGFEFYAAPSVAGMYDAAL